MAVKSLADGDWTFSRVGGVWIISTCFKIFIFCGFSRVGTRNRLRNGRFASSFNNEREQICNIRTHKNFIPPPHLPIKSASSAVRSHQPDSSQPNQLHSTYWAKKHIEPFKEPCKFAGGWRAWLWSSQHGKRAKQGEYIQSVQHILIFSHRTFHTGDLYWKYPECKYQNLSIPPFFYPAHHRLLGFSRLHCTNLFAKVQSLQSWRFHMEIELQIVCAF